MGHSNSQKNCKSVQDEKNQCSLCQQRADNKPENDNSCMASTAAGYLLRKDLSFVHFVSLDSSELSHSNFVNPEMFLVSLNMFPLNSLLFI